MHQSNIIFIKILSLSFAFGILFLLIYYIGIDTFISTVEKIPAWLLLLAVFIYSLSWYVRTKRTSLFIPNEGTISDFLLFKILIAGYALNIILPAKLGDIASIGFLKVRGLTIDTAIIVILQSRIMDVLGLICCTIPAFLYYLYIIPTWVNSVLIFGIILFLVPHVIILLYEDIKVPKWICHLNFFKSKQYFHVFLKNIQTIFQTYSRIVRDKWTFITTAGLSILIWSLEGLTCYALSVSLTPTITIIISIFAVSIANLGKIIPATPGSIGIFESLLSGILVIFGIPPSIAITVAIIDHLIKNSFVLIIGMPFASSLGILLLKRGTEKSI